MAHVRERRQPWNLPEREVTPEDIYLNRRQFVRRLGFGTVGAAAWLGGLGRTAVAAQHARDPRGPLDNIPPTPTADLYPKAPHNPSFVPGPRHGVVTGEEIVAAYNNFYEFTTDKESVWKLVEEFEARPWQIAVTGLVEEPVRFDLAELERSMPLEERIYRLRCVEAWSVVVPWIGFPLRALLERVKPTREARYVRFVSFLRPDQAVGQERQHWYPWPYFEGLRMDEAMNDLAFVVTGMYGHPLQKQNGAPVRIVAPWKYGYKSPKSIVRIELVREQPRTFWNEIAPDEYGFFSNVNPAVPHPRWSQATETVVATGDKVPTLPYNGYAEQVAQLYA